MANKARSSQKNDEVIIQLANSMAELVEQSDVLLKKMKDIKKRDEELEKIEKENIPKYENFSDSKYKEFKDSKKINIEDIREFISARSELDSIKEKRIALEEESAQINKEYSILTEQVSEAYEKIVEIINSSKTVDVNKSIYVKGLNNEVEIIDTYIREDREDVEQSLTEIIRTNSRIYDTLYDGYSKNITRVEKEPTDNYFETKNLINSLDELIKIQNMNIDSQIPLLNNPNQQKVEKKEIVVEKPVELSLDEEKPNNVINLEKIINKVEEVEKEQPVVVEDKEPDSKIITINIPFSLDASRKIATSNTRKLENIVSNFRKITPLILIEKISSPKLSVSNIELDQQQEHSVVQEENKSLQQVIDPIASFLGNNQAA